MNFKDNLKKYRESAGITSAKDFATTLGIPYQTYLNYENKGTEPKYDTLYKIATALHVTTDELLGFSYNEFKRCKDIAAYSGINVIFVDSKGNILLSKDSTNENPALAVDGDFVAIDFIQASLTDECDQLCNDAYSIIMKKEDFINEIHKIEEVEHKKYTERLYEKIRYNFLDTMFVNKNKLNQYLEYENGNQPIDTYTFEAMETIRKKTTKAPTKLPTKKATRRKKS